MKITILLNSILFGSIICSNAVAQEATAGATGNGNRSYEIKAGSATPGGIPNNGGDVIIESGSANHSNSSGNINIKTSNGLASGDINIETSSTLRSGGINLKASRFTFSSYVQNQGLVSFALSGLENYDPNRTRPGLKLGIGTTSPEDKLHIDNLQTNQGLTFGSKFKIRQSQILDNNFVMENIAPNGNLYLRSRIEGNTTGNLVINDKGGNVGINTSTPSEKLEVNGNIQLGAGDFLKGKRADGIKTNLIGYQDITTDHIINISEYSSGPSDVRIFTPTDPNQGVSIFSDKRIAFFRNDGNVGIGLNNPSKKLDVNGDIQLSGSLFKNNLELNINNLITTKYRVNMHSGGFIHGVDNNGRPAGPNDSSYRELPEGITSGTYSWWNYGRTKGQPGSYGAAVGFGDGKRGSAEIWSGWTSGKLYTRFLRDCCQGWSDWNQIWTSNSDGENSGMDADTVDGLQPILEQEDGTVGIGTSDTKGYKLAVDGPIISEEVKVQLSENWTSVPDYVFKEEYELLSLKEVEDYITQNGHLQNIPSAEEIEKAGGVNIGEMNLKLLEKIEELTLYTIQQEKQIDALELDNTKVKTLENKLKVQEQQLVLILQKLESLGLSK